MAPASKRSPNTEGMKSNKKPESDSAAQNSITVAAGISVAPASATAVVESGSNSPRSSSPEVMVRPTEEDPRTAVAVGPKKEDGNEQDDTDDKADKEQSNNRQMASPNAGRPAGRDYYHEYEYSDIDEIVVRQLHEDILAYRYDLDYCQGLLEDADDLTPQETRTLQLRTLDVNHQIRHCKHRIENIKAQTRKNTFRRPYGAVAYPANGTNGSGRQPQVVGGGNGVELIPGRRFATPATVAAGKRPAADEDLGGNKRPKMASPDFDMTGVGSDESVNTALQRLGFWKCRLCSAPKYLLAGAGRSPAAPCKWPLKDISKMITHFTEMHGEHTPAERCAELGAALAQNRGPFEYWLRRTRAQNISDGSVIDDCFAALLNGEMPDLIRRHSRAAAGMALH